MKHLIVYQSKYKKVILSSFQLKPGFHIIASVATIATVVENVFDTKFLFSAMVAIQCFHMIAAVAGFLSTRQESLGRMTTFEREVGAIFKMAAHANERLRILQLQTGIVLVLTAIQRRKKKRRADS